MVTLIKYGALSGGEKYNVNVLSIDGLSTDTKPTVTYIEYGSDGREVGRMGIPNGSIFTEIDTGDTYMYDADATTWHKVSIGGGGGGTQGGIVLVGETTTALTDEATTNPITVDGQSYTAQPNDAVIYGSKEFLFDGTKWHEFGDLSGLASKDIGAMTGYAKASTGSAIAPTDTLNQAIGKVEKRTEVNENNISTVCDFEEISYNARDYGINGTVGQTIHNTGSSSYKHGVVPINGGEKVKIYVDQTTSTTYPYYGMFTDAANKIIAVFAPTPTTAGVYYYEAIAPTGTTYLYVNTHITGNFKIKIYKYVTKSVGELNKAYKAIEFPDATVGGIKGTIGNQIETTTTSSYSYTKISVEEGQMYRIQTEMTDSTQYQYYVYFTTSNDVIVNYGLPRTGNVEVTSGYANVPTNATYMYVLCRGSSLPAVSIELVTEETIQSQINDIINNDSIGLPLLDAARNTVYNYNKNNKFVNFAFITDVHVNGTYASVQVDAKPNIDLFNTFCNEKWLDFGAFGGDLYSAYGLTMEQAIKTFDKATQMFGNCEIPLFMTKGNHECNAKDFTVVTDTSSLDWTNVNYYIYQYTIDGFQQITENQYNQYNPKPTLYVSDESTAAECITKSQWYLTCQNRLEDYYNISWDNTDRFGGYFYKDYDTEGVRIIVLNYYDTYNLEESGVHGTQLKWLAETALMTTKTVVIMAHNHGNASLISVLQAFVNGTSVSLTSKGVSISADYSTQGAGKIAGYIHGDDHEDNYNNSSGYNVIGVTRGFAYPTEYNTVNQYAFDIFTIDTSLQKIWATRVGRGENRSWSY